MNSKHIALIVIAIVVGIGLAFWPQQSDTPQQVDTALSAEEAKLLADADKELSEPVPDIEQIKAEIEAQVADEMAEQAQADPQNEADTDSAPWVFIDRDGDQRPTIPLSDKIKIAEAVLVNENTALLAEGETAEFLLPGGGKATVLVEKTRLHPNGDESWTGHLQDYGNRYPAAYTSGSTSAFATITTPEGSYSMESVNGVGWIYKNPAMEELSTPGFVDQLTPPAQ